MPNDYDGGVQGPVKMSFWKRIIIILIIIGIIAVIVYAVISVKRPEWLDRGTPEEPVDPTTGAGENSNALKVILFIVGGGAVVAVIALLIQQGKGKVESHKIPVAVDRALDLIREHFLLEQGIKGRYDKKRRVWVPMDSRVIHFGDRRPFFHTSTGSEFFLVETTIREGKLQGVHTLIFPIDRGEKLLQQGYYRLDRNTPRPFVSMQKITFPMASSQDRQDRIRASVLEGLDADKINPETMKSLGVVTPPSSTPGLPPSEAFGEGAPIPGMYPGYAPPRRRPAPRPRYDRYRRRY